MAAAVVDRSFNRSFNLFPYLNEDLKRSVLSFVADAPFESLPQNYPKSTLTHQLPQVSRKFRQFCNSDSYWKDAVYRQLKKEPFLWKPALLRVCGEKPDISKEYDDFESVELIEKAFENGDYGCYKDMYRHIVSKHLRFVGPVFFMGGQVVMGEPYSIHLFEPRYRLLLAEVMEGQPEDAKHGGRIQGDSAVFIHANRGPLAPTTPATLVRVTRCQMFPDGRADVVLLPIAYVWIENLWVRPNSGRLFCAQCLRMGNLVTQSMNQLARQEALASIMTRLAQDLADGDDEYLSLPSDGDHGSDNDSEGESEDDGHEE